MINYLFILTKVITSLLGDCKFLIPISGAICLSNLHQGFNDSLLQIVFYLFIFIIDF
jgi:hypothetical protein